MSDEHEIAVEELPLESAGARLRRAREEQKLTLDHVSAETRIPVRHLEVIEAGEFHKLPARTYAIGFSRTYAQVLGLDQYEIASEVRAELAQAEADREIVPAGMAPGDPAKLPSSGLAWAGAFGAILLVAGMVAFYSTYYSAGEGPAPLVAENSEQSDQDAAGAREDDGAPQLASVMGGEQVVFTALEEGIWVRFYDANGERLLEKEMASGERFEIPSDALEPRINTGRPDAFAITIGGQEVPKLANEPITIGDVQVSADALLARAEATIIPGARAATTVN